MSVPERAHQEGGTGLTGELGSDGALLATRAAASEQMLCTLPGRAQRTPAQQQAAEQSHAAMRRLRQHFMRLHAATVYDSLTQQGERYLRLPELAALAVERYPGLLPDAAHMAQEATLEQKWKESREIDQGIFFQGLLRDSAAGPHLLDAMLQPLARSRALLADFAASGYADLGKVVIERRGAAAYLTINNPDQLNAEDNDLMADLEVAVDLALLDGHVAVGVVRGGPVTSARHAGKRIFSAGINLKHLRNGQISFIDFILGRELGLLHKLVRGLALPDSETGLTYAGKPWIAAVDGFAIGGGAQLLLVFDHVIGAAGSYFSLPAAQEGIIPGAANFRLGQQLGHRAARQVILSGRRIFANEPAGECLFDEVVEPGAMEAAIDRAALALASPAVRANRHMLALTGEPPDAFRAYMAEFSLEQALRLYSKDVLDKVDGR